MRHDLRGGGIGKKLLLETGRVIALQDDQKVYIETSSRPQYAPMHAFYLRTGYRETVVLQDFYAPATPRSSSARPLQ